MTVFVLFGKLETTCRPCIPPLAPPIPLNNLSIPKNSRKSTHIGWSELEALDGSTTWNHNNILSGINVRTPMYFVHSFVARLTDPKCLLAQTDYYDIKISAVIMKENIYGCQFHPEKSGPYGLKVLLNFLNI